MKRRRRRKGGKKKKKKRKTRDRESLSSSAQMVQDAARLYSIFVCTPIIRICICIHTLDVYTYDNKRRLAICGPF